MKTQIYLTLFVSCSIVLITGQFHSTRSDNTLYDGITSVGFGVIRLIEPKGFNYTIIDYNVWLKEIQFHGNINKMIFPFEVGDVNFTFHKKKWNLTFAIWEHVYTDRKIQRGDTVCYYIYGIGKRKDEYMIATRNFSLLLNGTLTGYSLLD